MHALKRLVERKLTVVFPDPALRSRAAMELRRCDKPTVSSVERLQLAVLKLAQQDGAEIGGVVDGALEDPEDIVAWAERPNWMKTGIGNVRLTISLEAESECLDWQQYHDWLAQGLK